MSSVVKQQAAAGDAFSFEDWNPLTEMSWLVGCWADDPAWIPPAPGAAVSSWRNAGSLGGSLTQATAANRPTFYDAVSYGGAGSPQRTGIGFDGTGDILETTFTSRNQTFTSVAIATFDGPGDGSDDRIIDLARGASPFTCSAFRGPSGKIGMFGGSWIEDGPMTIFSGYAIRCKYAGASSAINVNGTNTTGNPGTGAANGFAVGGRPGTTTQDANMTAGFVGLFNGDITTHAKWNDFKAWVSDFYGLTIA